jgi:hypothetical protein
VTASSAVGDRYPPRTGRVGGRRFVILSAVSVSSRISLCIKLKKNVVVRETGPGREGKGEDVGASEVKREVKVKIRDV